MHEGTGRDSTVELLQAVYAFAPKIVPIFTFQINEHRIELVLKDKNHRLANNAMLERSQEESEPPEHLGSQL